MTFLSPPNKKMEHQSRPNPKHLTLIFIISALTFSPTTSDSKPSTPPLPRDIRTSAIAVKLRTDPGAAESASRDFGLIVREPPVAVFDPSSVDDVVSMVGLAYGSSVSFGVSARGQGHSVRGQAQVRDGVVVNMTSLTRGGERIVLSGGDRGSGFYADVGGEVTWIDLLEAALTRGLTPVSFTDYLYLSVGGTLSNAGIGGETFRRGPQINNVHEMDVVTGTGELVTCSRETNSELFYAVLGGLGQFGIITRARIVLDVSPNRVKWVRLFYIDVASFTKDQERLILENGHNPGNKLDYLEGSVLMANAPQGWADSFYPQSDIPRITSLVNKFGIVYILEVARFCKGDVLNQTTDDTELGLVFKGLRHARGFVFERDVTYLDFLNRVEAQEKELRSLGLWEVPHPWMNLFIPRSRILEFDSGVFRDIMVNGNTSSPLVLLYPMLRDKWDNKMSAAIPDEPIFYTVGLLHSSGFDGWEAYDNLNAKIWQFCEKAEIKCKQYLPHYGNKEDWKKHFGSKWTTFESRKARFDPKLMLSRGQGIFN